MNNKCFNANFLEKLDDQLNNEIIKSNNQVIDKELFLKIVNNIFIKHEISIEDANKVADDIHNSEDISDTMSESDIPSLKEIIESINNSSLAVSKTNLSIDEKVVTTNEDSVEAITENNLLKISNTDREIFYKVVRDSLIRLSFINKYDNTLNIHGHDINKSFLSLKNELVSKLRKELAKKGKVYDESDIFTKTTDHEKLNALLKDFDLYIFSNINTK